MDMISLDLHLALEEASKNLQTFSCKKIDLQDNVDKPNVLTEQSSHNKDMLLPSEFSEINQDSSKIVSNSNGILQF